MHGTRKSSKHTLDFAAHARCFNDSSVRGLCHRSRKGGWKMKAGPRLILNLVFSAILIASAVTVADAKDRGGQSGGQKKSGGGGAYTGAANKSTGVVQTGPIVRDHSGNGTPRSLLALQPSLQEILVKAPCEITAHLGRLLDIHAGLTARAGRANNDQGGTKCSAAVVIGA